jgi:hypothetical protein
MRCPPGHSSLYVNWRLNSLHPRRMVLVSIIQIAPTRLRAKPGAGAATGPERGNYGFDRHGPRRAKDSRSISHERILIDI